MPPSLWSDLFGWVVCGAIATLFVGSAVGVMSMSPPQYGLAELFFALGFSILATRAGWWFAFEVPKDSPRSHTVIAASIVFGVIGTTFVLAVRWVEGLRPLPTVTASAGTTPTITTDKSPLILEMTDNGFGKLRIKNPGMVDITDVKTGIVKYALKDTSPVVEIGFYQKVGGEFPIARIIKKGKEVIFDLNSNPITMLQSPGKDLAEMNAQMRSFQCLRVTFRDSRTGKKYFKFKIVGVAIGGMSDATTVASFGGGNPAIDLFYKRVPIVLIEHAKSLYSDDATEYQP